MQFTTWGITRLSLQVRSPKLWGLRAFRSIPMPSSTRKKSHLFNNEGISL